MELRAKIMEVCYTVSKYLCWNIMIHVSICLEEVARQNGDYTEHTLY